MRMILKGAAALFAALAMVIGLTWAAQASPKSPDVPTDRGYSQASVTSSRPVVTGSCRGTGCTVYLSKAETISLSQGRVPAPPAFVPLPLRAAYYVLAYGHIVIAKGWVGRRTCVAFNFDIRPWVSQGMLGWRCAW